MTRKPIDYTNACIYKICCKSPHIEDVYVGSTTNLVKRRFSHKCDCNKPNGKHYNFPVYKFIREHGGWGDWDVVKVENFNCDCSSDLRQRERYWLEKLRATLNGINPFLSPDERKEQKLKCQKAYYTEHKEELLEKNAKYHNENRQAMLQNMREYHQKNKQKHNEIRKMRYQNEKETVLSRMKEKVTCEHCGNVVTKGGLSAHHKTKKCRAARAN